MKDYKLRDLRASHTLSCVCQLTGSMHIKCILFFSLVG